MMKICKCMVVTCIVVCYMYGQSPVLVTQVQSSDATAYNNSHKIIPLKGEGPSGDTMYVVYHSSDSIYMVRSSTRGLTWEPPTVLYSGIYPGFDIDEHGCRHIVWQHYEPAHSTYDIYYDCLEDWAPPVNISNSPGNSTLADVVADSNIVAHITWVEEYGGSEQIFYCTCQGDYIDNMYWVSNGNPAPATHSHPSISIFAPNYRIAILWDCYEPGSYSPYQIHLRCKEDTLWLPLEYWASYLTLRHSSIDFSHGSEEISACWEDSTSGNLDAFFYEGNGGGYPTPGNSQYPVISTVGDIWSYLFWQEDSTTGYVDILIDLYYFSAGWSNHSLRYICSIDEPVYFPSTCGAYLVWTQGTEAPYELYFNDFGYPVGSEEHNARNAVAQISCRPNPFAGTATITFTHEGEWPTHSANVHIYNAAGQLITTINTNVQDNMVVAQWDGCDRTGMNMPSGTYFCVSKTPCATKAARMVKIK